MTRAFWIIPLATAGLIASSTPAAVTMRIEALGYFPPASVEITTASFAEEHKKAKLRPDSVAGLPMSMEIGDSIQRIHVVASGFGSIQVTLINPEAGDSLVSVGRDITLTRKLNEPFRRIWTVQPLVP
jgi:hypothetical protein